LFRAQRLLTPANGKLEVRFFDVGQDDAILVSCPEGSTTCSLIQATHAIRTVPRTFAPFSHMTSTTTSAIIRDLSAGVSEFVQRAVGRVSQKLSLAVSKPNLTGK
jgi:beta-lactamase superfamily II metal-dependent hydrolase